MIVYLTQGVTRIAFRLKTYGNQSQLADWRGLQLLILPGEAGCPCGEGGSPWYFYGCWFRGRTGEDVANFRPDIPAICYNAFEVDDEGQVVFRLDDRLYDLPPGRYTGILRIAPKIKPLNLTPLYNLGKVDVKDKVILPPGYELSTVHCEPVTPVPPAEPKTERRCCDLAMFDIDLGPACVDHYIDQAAVTLALDNCTREL
jgi:hypothetical protein